VVYATSSTSTYTLRSLFDNSLSVYLGKISYALYLVHGPVVHMLGFWLVPWFWSRTGKETQFQKEMGFGAAFICVTIAVVWSADLFWRGVDKRCVVFARWLEGLMVMEEWK
jgi:peptidoglycan/LPS O-acetylase OafA/YrhL